MNKPTTNGIITMWLLFLQEFNITILDRPGRENVVAYFLSIIHNEGELVHVNDNFPDDNLFAISIKFPWFADISNYLATGKLQQHISPKEKQRIVKLSATYSWIGGELFCIGTDLIIRRCVQENEVFDLLNPCHDEPCGGHFVNKRTVYKVLHPRYYWHTLFRDAKKYVRSCENFQWMG
jgi:hypothetical protein